MGRPTTRQAHDQSEVPTRSEVLLIGGRSGVGKSSVGNEIHVQLSAASVKHCFIEGDNLDMAFPAPWEFNLAERNLSAIWANYRDLGYRRMVYTNTVSVREAAVLAAAMGDDPRVIGVLLTSRDETARDRLARRERGSALDWHVDRSNLMARELDVTVPDWVHRVPTDDRTITEVATEMIELAGWRDPDPRTPKRD